MNSGNKILSFIKAVDAQYYDRFLLYGEICLHTVKWFRDYEHLDSNIGDEFEGVRTACGKDFTIEFAEPIINYSSNEDLQEKIKSSDWTMIGKGINLKMFDESENANVFSLYALISDDTGMFEGPLLPKKFVDEFSNHKFVMFLDPNDFQSKIETALSQYQKPLKHGLVKYYTLDETMRQNLSYFDKQERLAYQQEFRFVVEDLNIDPLVLQLGALKDICIEIDTEKEYSIIPQGDGQFEISEKQ